MFIDHVKIKVKAGQGGSGACSFRREKHVPKGGPDGGDGGRGGSILLEVDPHMNTLINFRYKNQFSVRHGQHGMGSTKHGRDAANLTLKVPPGTVVKEPDSGKILADLIERGDQFVAARGGKGGRGNARFTTSTHQAPREWEVGEAGEDRWLVLELKTIADVGLVGKPNAGKSTLLSRISAAQPKIADYPFTTLQPNLGIVKTDNYRSFVVADIPGLIEGAHQGKGLGIQFLRHIERTRLLAFLIDPVEEDLLSTFEILKSELRQYSESLLNKPVIIVLTKKDIWQEDFEKKVQKSLDFTIVAISAVSGEHIDELKWLLLQEVEKISTAGAEN